MADLTFGMSIQDIDFIWHDYPAEGWLATDSEKNGHQSIGGRFLGQITSFEEVGLGGIVAVIYYVGARGFIGFHFYGFDIFNNDFWYMLGSVQSIRLYHP